ncbi:hypothetical protein GQ457_09G024090 [Hibiscus cannabinus]
MAALEFIDYAFIWLDQLNISRRYSGEGPVTTWREMKAIMRRRFVPTHYHRDLLQKLQSLKQGNKSVEDYDKKMEIVLIRANINEDQEATMKRRGKGSPPPPKEENLEEEEEEIEELTIATGEIHVVKKTVSVQTKEEDKEQRENIFHTRCQVEKEACSLIIDSGSCTNVASTFLINEIGMKTYKHPNPYRLQWLNNGELKKAINDGYTNCYSFMHQDKLVNLTPLTPKQVKYDQVQMKKYIENFKVKLQRTKDKGRSKVTHDEKRPIEMKKCDPTHERGYLSLLLRRCLERREGRLSGFTSLELNATPDLVTLVGEGF